MQMLIRYHSIITYIANLSIMTTGLFIGITVISRKKSIYDNRFVVWFMVFTLMMNVLDLFLNMRYGPIGAL